MRKRIIVNDLLDEMRDKLHKTPEMIAEDAANLFEVASQNKVGRKIMYQVPLHLIAIDDSYQRTETFSKTKGEEIANHFIEEAYDPIKLNLRNGIFYCPAGQHRIYAHIIMKKNFIGAELFRVSYESEVKIFLSQDDNRSKLTPYDRYKAGLACHNKEDILLQRICNKYNVGVGCATEGTVAKLCSITTAKSILNIYGENAADWMFSIIHEAGWTTDRKGFASCHFRALRGVYKNVEDPKKAKDRIVTFLQDMTPEEFYANAILLSPTRNIEVAMSKLLMDVVEGKRKGKPKREFNTH